MNRVILNSLALIGLAQASPTLAQSHVLSSFSAWEQHVRDRIDAKLVYPEAADGAAGDVLVGFRVGRDGKPAGIVIRRSSGNLMFDQAALQLVASLGRLGAVPSMDRTIDDIVLKISYGDPSSTDAESERRARARLKEQLLNDQRNRKLVSTSSQIAERL